MGEGYQAQRQFRMKWAQMELTQIRQRKVEMQKLTEMSESDGSYLAFDLIVVGRFYVKKRI